jgi:cytochrome bd-type quinol oxidase subunit 2
MSLDPFRDLWDRGGWNRLWAVMSGVGSVLLACGVVIGFSFLCVGAVAGGGYLLITFPWVILPVPGLCVVVAVVHFVRTEMGD